MLQGQGYCEHRVVRAGGEDPKWFPDWVRRLSYLN
ncbi:MAG: hypothetical protein ACI80F_002222 [Natronomonas sp.]|jgi:hypothetical protein